MPLTARQQEYLKAMGVEVWVPRTAALPVAASEPHAATTSEDMSPNPATSPVNQTTPDSPGPLATRDWDSLISNVTSCTACALHSTRTQTVFGVGNRRAELMLIGEAPGAEEDKQGEPFVGRAGQLLNNMLKAIGMTREQVYIANILKCRPPNNRDPAPEEAAQCVPYLQQQIRLIQPKLILALGRIAAQRLLQCDTPLGKLRGHTHLYSETNTPMVVTYHPAYLLRSPSEKRKAWEDLLYVKTRLQQAGDGADN